MFIIRRIIGKRRRSESNSSTQAEESSALDEPEQPSNTVPLGLKKLKSPASLTTIVDPEEAATDGKTMSGSAKCTQRVPTPNIRHAKNGRSRNSTQPNRNGLIKDRVREPTTSSYTADSLLQHTSTAIKQPRGTKKSLKRSLSSEDEPSIKPTRHPILRSKIARTHKVQKAITELRKAEAEAAFLSKKHDDDAALLLNDNLFSRPLSLSQQSPRPPMSSETSEAISNKSCKVEEVVSLKASPFFKIVSDLPSPSNQEAIDESAPIEEFKRRLSEVARALANGEYSLPTSDTLVTTGDMSKSNSTKPGAISTTGVPLASTVKEMVEEMLQRLEQQEETIKKSEERMKNETERLATLIATQPPTSTPAQSYKENKILFRIAEVAAVQGAKQASLSYQKMVRDGHLPAMQRAIKEPVSDRFWLMMEPQNDPGHFCSTKSWAAQHWRRTLSVPMTQEEMFASLKADEARYRSAFITSAVQMMLGGNVERRLKSRYPLHNLLQRQMEEQEQEQQRLGHHTVYQAHQVTNVNLPSLAQSTVAAQTADARKASWAMDVDTAPIEDTRAPIHHTWLSDTKIPSAPWNQHNTRQITPHIFETNLNLARGYCSFGDKGAKRHGAPVSVSQENFSDVNYFQKEFQYNELSARNTRAIHHNIPTNVFARSSQQDRDSSRLKCLPDHRKEQALDDVITRRRIEVNPQAQAENKLIVTGKSEQRLYQALEDIVTSNRRKEADRSKNEREKLGHTLNNCPPANPVQRRSIVNVHPSKLNAARPAAPALVVTPQQQVKQDIKKKLFNQSLTEEML